MDRNLEISEHSQSLSTITGMWKGLHKVKTHFAPVSAIVKPQVEQNRDMSTKLLPEKLMNDFNFKNPQINFTKPYAVKITQT